MLKRQTTLHPEAPVRTRPSRFFPATAWPWLIIACGIGIRLFHFAYNRSLFYDESHIALNLIYRDFAGLASPPLYYDQQAPLGFLWAVELCTRLFGISEYALRLFPLLCGLAALPLFYLLVRQFMAPVGVIVALLCLAFAHPVVYHAVEIKQYETELLCTILAYLAYFRYRDRYHAGRLQAWALAGSLLVWFSLTSVFILAGIGLATLIPIVLRKEWRKAGALTVVFGAWGIAFLVNYVLFISTGTEISWLRDHWARQEAFMPLPPGSLSGLLWFVRIGFKALDYPLGVNWQFLPGANILVRFSVLGTAFFSIGVVALVREYRSAGWVFVVPVALAFGASAFKVYPMLERLLVFVAPVLIVFIAFGAHAVYSFFKNAGRPAVGLVLLMAFAAAPVANATLQLLRPQTLGGGKQIDLRQAFQYVHGHRQAADLVYVTSSFENPFRYYRQLHGYSWDKLPIRENFDNLMPSHSLVAYQQEVRKSLNFTGPGRRVWVVLYPSQLKYLDENQKVQVTSYLVSDVVKRVLDEQGTVKDQYTGNNVLVYLYQF